jgi:hypothetical protein
MEVAKNGHLFVSGGYMLPVKRQVFADQSKGLLHE